MGRDQAGQGGAHTAVRAIAYTRVSTAEQADSRLGLDAQREAIVTAARARGWQLVEIIEDGGASGKNLRRPGIARALELLGRGEADALVAAKLDRLSRSVIDFCGLLARAERESWGLVALDVDVDTTSPNGRMVARLMSVIAEWERDIIGQRTKDALAARKRDGKPLGRPPLIPGPVVERILSEHRCGRSLNSIAQGLNADGVPTAGGGRRWYASTIRWVVHDRVAS